MSSVDQSLDFEYHSKTYQVPMSLDYLYKQTAQQTESDVVVLMLHGYYDKASSFLKRAFAGTTPPFSILAPNAPFPVPRLKPNEIKEGYSWYFYNYISKKMVVSPDVAVQMLTSLVCDLNLTNKKIIIVGFSQGGFLAPLVAQKINAVAQRSVVQKIICIGAAFRDDFWNPPFQYSVDAIHGEEDDVVTLQRAETTFLEIQKKGVQGHFHKIPHLGHSLNEHAQSVLYACIEEELKKSGVNKNFSSNPNSTDQ